MCTAYRASFRHILNKVTVCFRPLFATTHAFNICIFEIEFGHFFRGVCLGVYSVHHCHQEELTQLLPFHLFGAGVVLLLKINTVAACPLFVL